MTNPNIISVSLDDLEPSLKQSWEQGLRHFNDEEFWEAHEAWEDVWHHLNDHRRLYLQGLIQAAASLVHVQKDNPKGCFSLAHKAIEKLSQYDLTSPLELNPLMAQLNVMARYGTLKEAPVKLGPSHATLKKE